MRIELDLGETWEALRSRPDLWVIIVPVAIWVLAAPVLRLAHYLRPHWFGEAVWMRGGNLMGAWAVSPFVVLLLPPIVAAWAALSVVSLGIVPPPWRESSWV